MNIHSIKKNSLKQILISSLMVGLLVAPLSSVNASNIDHIDSDKIDARSDLITLQDSLSYKIGDSSTHIYFNGNVTISYSPKGGSQGIHISVYRVGGGPEPVESNFFSGSGSVTYKLYQYHYVVVTGDSGVTGTYKVTY